MRFANAVRLILIVLLPVSLAGCFASETALIGPGDAAYPFETITYTPDGEDDPVTVKRVGDRYVVAAEKKNVSLRLKALGDDVFVVQISEVQDKKPTHIYGYIKLAPDRSHFDLIKGLAEDEDLTAARAGEAGFGICEDDDGMVCIGTLEGFIDYAGRRINPGGVVRFNILQIE